MHISTRSLNGPRIVRHCRFTHVCSDTTQLLATYIDQDSFIHPNCIRWAPSIVLINVSVKIEKKKPLKGALSQLTYPKQL